MNFGYIKVKKKKQFEHCNMGEKRAGTPDIDMYICLFIIWTMLI